MTTYSNDPGNLYILDLQRVRQRNRIRGRDRIKDLAQLYYSSTTVTGITRTDRLRFFKEYLQKGKLESLDKILLKKVINKAIRIDKHTKRVLQRRLERQCG